MASKEQDEEQLTNEEQLTIEKRQFKQAFREGFEEAGGTNLRDPMLYTDGESSAHSPLRSRQRTNSQDVRQHSGSDDSGWKSSRRAGPSPPNARSPNRRAKPRSHYRRMKETRKKKTAEYGDEDDDVTEHSLAKAARIRRQKLDFDQGDKPQRLSYQTLAQRRSSLRFAPT